MAGCHTDGGRHCPAELKNGIDLMVIRPPADEIHLASGTYLHIFMFSHPAADISLH